MLKAVPSVVFGQHSFDKGYDVEVYCSVYDTWAEHDFVIDSTGGDSDTESEDEIDKGEGVTGTLAQSLVAEVDPQAKVRCEPKGTTGIFWQGSLLADAQSTNEDCYINGGDSTSEAEADSNEVTSKGEYEAENTKTTSVTMAFNFSSVQTYAELDSDLEIEVDGIHYKVDADYDGSGGITKRYSKNGGATWFNLPSWRQSYSPAAVSLSITSNQRYDVRAKTYANALAEDFNATGLVNEDAGGNYQAQVIVQ